MKRQFLYSVLSLFPASTLPKILKVMFVVLFLLSHVFFGLLCPSLTITDSPNAANQLSAKPLHSRISVCNQRSKLLVFGVVALPVSGIQN